MANILIADDSMFSRKVLADIIEQSGHTIAGEAENGQQAVELYKQVKPDIVILDITMPVIDGLSASEEILSFDPNAKIVICSALRQDYVIEFSYKIGVKAYLIKPFDPIKINRVISELIAKS